MTLAEYELGDKNKYLDMVLGKEIAAKKTKDYFGNSQIVTSAEEIFNAHRDEFRNIDKETDVLSFPMFEKQELDEMIAKKQFEHEDVLGDIIISIARVEEQAKEYGHSFERELSYMVVHGFYHVMGYDHIKEEDKVKMRPKEEKILNDLKILREC